MAYTPQTWTDGSLATPLSAARLTVMENGIEDADNRLTALEAVAISAQTGSYTVVLADAGKAVEVNSASATNVTMPPNSSVAFPIGTVMEVTQLGAGQVTLVAGSGVTLRSSNGLKLRAQYSAASLRKRATDEWVVAGDVSV